MTIDLDALESAAKAATPGAWEEWHAAGYPYIVQTNMEGMVDVISECRMQKNSIYIAAANPAVVLELVAELRAKNAMLEEIFDDCGDKDSGVCPVCHTYTHKHWCWYPHLVRMLGKPLDEHDERFLALDNAICTAAQMVREKP